MLPTLGIDLSHRTFDATLRHPDGTRAHHAFPNTPDGMAALQTWLATQAALQVHACMEATNTYWEALTTALHTQGHTVSVVNPARIKGFAQAEMQRNKTDKLDSALIAAFCARHTPTPWEPLVPEHAQLRTLVRHRDDVVATRKQVEQQRAASRSAFVQQSFTAVVDALDAQIKAVEAEYQAHLAAHPTLQTNVTLLTSIVGWGW